ncbi:hypothetical protein [Chitinilyticum litopenaei]|uniref:hypothetical protein n=1 Tax=Chitinilyticum litopenaei TaxID=1121276 RepID=UPI000420B12F|nr:hypothetical protein [Chitinilyticum litopenaei]
MSQLEIGLYSIGITALLVACQLHFSKGEKADKAFMAVFGGLFMGGGGVVSAELLALS